MWTRTCSSEYSTYSLSLSLFLSNTQSLSGDTDGRLFFFLVQRRVFAAAAGLAERVVRPNVKATAAGAEKSS